MFLYIHCTLNFLILVSLVLPLVQASTPLHKDCRCFPGDACWPKQAEWDKFNASIDGRLIKTIPLASSCHDDAFGPYDSDKCSYLRNHWPLPELHLSDPSSIMASYFANSSCNPFQARSDRCIVGTLVQFTVNVSDVSHVQKTLGFARQHNIRIVIRNTAHDYLGKSNGPGAIAIWTHHLKRLELVGNYSSPHYTGKAVLMGAGVEGHEMQSFASSHRLRLVGGNCPTVGVAGGYTQGGGHGPLASQYGLAADQALEWQVVTSNGSLLTATPQSHRELYWALSGGGGGTYGIVLSLTSRAFPDGGVAAANMTVPSMGLSQDVFFTAVQSFLETLPSVVDAGATVIWVLTSEALVMSPTTAPGLKKTRLDELWKPMLGAFEKLSVQYDYQSFDFPSYRASYMAMNAPTNVTNVQGGGRLIPRSLVQRSSSALTSALGQIVSDGAVISGVTVSVPTRKGAIPNAVLPAWRDALISIVVATPYNETDTAANVAYQLETTNTWLPLLEKLTPGGGAYLNEADFRQSNYEQAFYGGNYDRLERIKRKYDPEDVFYARTAVGSCRWHETSDGRLCRT